jgi:predicted permease
MNRLREWLNRLTGTARPGRRDEDLAAELRSHLELAEDEARRREPAADAVRLTRLRAGGTSQAMDALRDQRGWPIIDALAADVVFGWRQLNKHRGVSLAAILSLGLAIGAATAAFRLLDAVMLRHLPVAAPERLSFLTRTFLDSEGRTDYRDDFDYPTLRQYRDQLDGRAAVMLLGMAVEVDARIGGGEEPERVFRQYVSGNVFNTFGLQPALGRLIGATDDRVPGGHPVTVISDGLWVRRFGRSPGVLGNTIQLGSVRYEIIGVLPPGFTGTEPGRLTDVFIPAVMNTAALDSPGWSWFRIWIRPNDGTTANEIQQMLQARFSAEHLDRVKSFPAGTPQPQIDAFLNEQIRLLPAGAGVSDTQKSYRQPLIILSALIALVLLVACANVANLMTGQALTRAHEMALRLSIGAARSRLVQLVLIESLLLALVASGVGALFAWWSAPFVVSLLAPPEDPVRLVLTVDWRALAFGAALTLGVTTLFGLVPALRASSVKPMRAMRGGEDPHAHRRLTGSLIAAQMAFSVAVLFVAGLFVATFQRLASQPLGFSVRGLVLVEINARATLTSAAWDAVADHVRQTPGVESAAFACWTPLSGNGWTGNVTVDGRPAPGRAPYFLSVSPAYFETMNTAFVDGRDFRPGDVPPIVEKTRAAPGVGIVNESFARAYFDGQNPVGRRLTVGAVLKTTIEVVGVVRDAVYRSVREPMRPQVFLPLESRDGGTLVFRTAGDPAVLGPQVSRDLKRLRPDIRWGGVSTMTSVVRSQMLRERLLATLSVFFAAVALILAAVGLHGVLSHAVIRQRREIGIRIALGARPLEIVKRVSGRMLALAAVGAAGGVVAGVAAGRFVETLLFRVTAGDPIAFAGPLAALSVAVVAALMPPALRALRVDPVKALRSE